MLALNDRLGIKQQAAQGKISVRLLEFAEPMIAEAFEGDGEPSAADLESVLKGVVMIWNAKVMEQDRPRLRFRKGNQAIATPESRPPRQGQIHDPADA